MRKVLVVVPWLEGGGAQKALIGIVKQLEDCHVSVVALFERCANYDAVLDVVDDAEFWNYSRSLAGTIRAARRLAQLLESQEFDAVYSLLRASSIVIALNSDLRNISSRLAVSVHQIPSEDSKGWRGRIEEMLHRRTLKNAALVTSPSEVVVQYIKDEYGIDGRRVVVDPNILNLEVGSRPIGAFAQDEPLRLVFCGRLTAQKGLERLIRIAALVTRPLHVRIVGDGELMLSLQRTATEVLPDLHIVRFLGRSNDVNEHLDWAHAAVMPSLSELEPVFVWEAWSRGRAVIATRIPAFERLSRTGPLVLFNDDEELSRILTLLTSESPEIHDCVLSGHRAALARSHSRSRVASFLDGPRTEL